MDLNPEDFIIENDEAVDHEYDDNCVCEAGYRQIFYIFILCSSYFLFFKKYFLKCRSIHLLSDGKTKE